MHEEAPVTSAKGVRLCMFSPLFIGNRRGMRRLVGSGPFGISPSLPGIVAWHPSGRYPTRFGGGNLEIWYYQRGDDVYQLAPSGLLIYSAGTATDLGVASAVAGLGVIYLFENWLRPAIDSGKLEPLLQPWWQTFSGPYLYYSGCRLVPSPLRAFIDFIQSTKDAVASFPDR